MAGPRFDFVIVGSGVGGLAAAIAAKHAGMQPLLLEKTPLIGGSSALSGGVLWLPNNPLMARAGVVDSRDAGLEYLRNFVPDDATYSTPARRAAFVDAIGPMVTQLEQQGMQFRRCPGYSDYYDLLPGGNAAGRSLEAELFDASRLGDWRQRFRGPYVALPIRTSEGARVMQVGVSWGGRLMAARAAGRYAWNKLTRRTVYGSGGALQGRLLEIALRLGVEIWTEAPLVDLDIRNGQVEGVHLTRGGSPVTVPASRGVLIAAGGFAHNLRMRKQYGREPVSDRWTHANPGDTGEALEVMMRAGAGVALMEEAWWIMTWISPSGEAMQIVPECTKPHGILVDHAGQRMVNEANSYMEIGRAVYARHAQTTAFPAWLIMDAQARRRYFFALRPPGRMPPEWVSAGAIKVDSTIAGLARQCGIDAAGLEATVQRFNGFCRSGIDADYGRGASIYNRYYADPTNRPNPSLGEIGEPPYWAAPLWPGDVGTCGGVAANERAQVLRADGSTIAGLYATGNCTASLCGPWYVGAGQSIGASSVFGYIAAQHAAG